MYLPLAGRCVSTQPEPIAEEHLQHLVELAGGRLAASPGLDREVLVGQPLRRTVDLVVLDPVRARDHRPEVCVRRETASRKRADAEADRRNVTAVRRRLSLSRT